MPITIEHMMGYVCFVALETNGTFLLDSIIDEDMMCCHDTRGSVFVKEVNWYGMCAALIFAGQQKKKNTGMGNIYGLNKPPRH